MSLCKKVGGRESDTYISIAEADAYLTNGPDDVSDWSSLTTAEKELRLRLAAKLMGYLPWRSYRIYDGQALEFPRSGFGPKDIPNAIKEAQAWIAYSVVHRSLVNRPAVSETVGGSVRSVSLGGMLAVTFADSNKATGSLMERLTANVGWPIYSLLKPFIAQIRGRVITDAADYTLSTTSTTETTTTTTTSTSTTTTTAL